MSAFEPIGAAKIKELRNRALRALSELSSRGRDPDAEIRVAILETLAEFHSELQELLSRGVHDGDEIVRTTALEVLGDCRFGWLTTECTTRLEKDRSSLVRSTAAVALGDAYGEYRIDPRGTLASSLKREKDEEVRASVYYALAKLGLDRYFHLFLKGLRHPFYRIRTASANLLPGLVDRSRRVTAVRALRHALKTEQTVAAREAIENALQELSKQRPPAAK